MAGRAFTIVGGGKMGEAILSGWLSSAESPADAITESDIIVIEPGGERRAYLEATYGVACFASAADAVGVAGAADAAEAVGTADAAEAVGAAGAGAAGAGAAGAGADGAGAARVPDVVVLAVKPQVMMGVLEGLTGLSAFQGGACGPLFVSIAAGLTTERIAAALPDDAPLVRVMPNMPLMVGAGASGVCGGASASGDQVRYVAGLFGCLGRAVVVEESDMDAVCAVSGSGPAYVAALVEAMRDAGAAQGLDPALAEVLALQTVLGTARLIDETPLTPGSAREAVCSPGGTTLAALDAMDAAGFTRAIDAGIAAAVARSKELAQS